MATYQPPKKNTAFIIYTSLVSQADTKLLKSGPTLAAGDFKVSTDGAAFANLATLPTNTPSGVLVKISLSAGEMNGDNISIACIDAAGAEWCDQLINVQTAARQIDDLAYPATSGRSIVVDASGLVDSNVVKLGPTGSGTAQTARDIGTSVLLSTGTGAGQLDFTSGVVKSNLAQILGTALTETAGLIAAGFKQFFNISSPTSTMNTITAVTTTTTATNLTTNNDKTGYGLSAATIQAIWDALTSALTTVGSIGKLIVTNVDAVISSRGTSTYSGTDTSGTTTLLSRLTSGRATNLDNLDATVSTRATPAQVLTQVDASLDTAGAELASVPSTTGTLRQKINYLFQYFRNKRTVTSTTETLFKENASTSLGTSTVSDDGTTFTKGETN